MSNRWLHSLFHIDKQSHTHPVTEWGTWQTHSHTVKQSYCGRDVDRVVEWESWREWVEAKGKESDRERDWWRDGRERVERVKSEVERGVERDLKRGMERVVKIGVERRVERERARAGGWERDREGMRDCWREGWSEEWSKGLIEVWNTRWSDWCSLRGRGVRERGGMIGVDRDWESGGRERVERV